MTPAQKDLLRQSCALIEQRVDPVAARFYAHLFESHPQVRSMFLGSMKYQRVKFMDMLRAVVDNLDRLDEVVTSVWQLGKRHAGYGVKDEHYDAVREALIRALQEELGSSITNEVTESWRVLYDLMAAAMKQAAAEGPIPRP